MNNCKDNFLVNEKNSMLEFSIISAMGDRDEQQDCFGYSINNNECLIVVCDGMGGHEGGRTASAVAVECFISEYKNSYPNYDPCELLINSALIADKKISSLKDTNGNNLNAGSTAVTILIKNRELYWCSIGDSRAYMLRNNEFVQITKDQTYRTVLEEQRYAGLITQDEYLKK